MGKTGTKKPGCPGVSFSFSGRRSKPIWNPSGFHSIAGNPPNHGKTRGVFFSVPISEVQNKFGEQYIVKFAYNTNHAINMRQSTYLFSN
jgi:hypothetical protein